MSKDGCTRSLGAIILVILFQLNFNTNLFAQEGQDTTQMAQAPAEEVQDQGSDDGIPNSEEAISAGETLFNNNCTVCHQIHQQVVGPALANVTERRPVPWLINFIRNSQQVIQSGDEYAVEIYNQFNKTVMPAFDYSDDEILNVLAYIKQESQQGPEAEAADGEVAAGGGGGALPESISTYLNAILVGILVVMVLILLVLVLLISILTKYLKQKEDLDEEEREAVGGGTNWQAIFRSKALIGMIAFIFTAIVVKSVIDGMYKIGVQQGYQPSQPVWFSHKIHAGQYQIDCNYCHTGVEKSKSANIPSVNICMNCHNPNLGGIMEGAVYGEREITKVVNAWETQTPIEWVRVHNLPDLAYFNHAQHVNVGGVECQTCHGPIEEMDVVYQHSTLTMGWCIECHRTTEVNVKGNEYYDKLVEVHQELGKEVLYVEDIGGTECSRCHY